MQIAEEIADLLLQIKAIQLNTEKPFLWASGIESPVYCDNRLILSDVQGRKKVIHAFASLAAAHFPGINCIAGVATAGIAHGALLAQQLALPFIYVRSSPKGHGKQNQIEGALFPGCRALVIEDLISTGGSSLQAVRALQEAGCEVPGVLAIFSYGLKKAAQAFHEADCRLETLSDFNTLVRRALDTGYLQQSQLEYIQSWRDSIDSSNV